MGNENGTEDFVFCSELLDHRNARLVYCSTSVLLDQRVGWFSHCIAAILNAKFWLVTQRGPIPS